MNSIQHWKRLSIISKLIKDIIKELTEKYRDLPMDFPDSCLVLLAEKMGLNEIATIDRDFSIYRINWAD